MKICPASYISSLIVLYNTKLNFHLAISYVLISKVSMVITKADVSKGLAKTEIPEGNSRILTHTIQLKDRVRYNIAKN